MKNELAIITGGTKGIGLALVKKFLKEGFHVFTCASGTESVDALKNEIQDSRLSVSRVDLNNKLEIKEWASKVLAQGLPVSVLINNAGRFLPGSVSEEEDEVFEKMISTNLGSAYHTTRAFVHAMKSQKRGHIFNICSTASITAYTNGGSYCISKFGLLGMGKVLREELKTDGIKVSSVLPGATFTDSWAGAGLPESRFMKPEDIADIVWAAYSLSDSCVMEEILLRPMAGDIV